MVLIMSHCAQDGMALVHWKLENFATALQLETEVLEIRVSKLGSKHPNTLKAEHIVNRLQLALKFAS